MALHGGHCGVCTSYASLNRSIAVSALTPICIDKLCGRMNPEVAGKTHRSGSRHSPRSIPLSPLSSPQPGSFSAVSVRHARPLEWLASFSVGKILREVPEGSTSFRGGKIGRCRRAENWIGGREARVQGEPRLDARRLRAPGSVRWLVCRRQIFRAEFHVSRKPDDALI